MVLPLLGLSGAVAIGTVLLPYRLPLAGLAVVLQVTAHIVAGRNGRRSRRRRPPAAPAAPGAQPSASPLLWVGTAGTIVFVGITLLVGAHMGMVL